MDINITILGLDAVDHILDRLTERGETEQAEQVERAVWDCECARSELIEALRKIAGDIPEEEEETEMEKRWHPAEGETYYYVETSYGGIGHAVWRNGKMDRVRYRLHNVFESVEAAYHYVENVEEDDGQERS